MSLRRLEGPTGMSFSNAVVAEGAGSWIHVSGQVGLGDSGEVVEGGLRLETLAAFKQIEEILQKAGGDRDDVVRITAFLTDLNDYAEYARARAEFLGNTFLRASPWVSPIS